MLNEQFTDEDIQNYVDGTFSGDVAALENYIEQNLLAQQQVQDYRFLISIVREQEAPALSFDLAGAVVNKLELKRPSRAGNTWWIAASVVVVAVLLLLLPFNRLFSDIDNPVFFAILCMALCAGITMFHVPEIMKRKKIFSMK